MNGFDEDRGVEITIYRAPVTLFRGTTLATLEGGSGIAVTLRPASTFKSAGCRGNSRGAS